MIVADDHWAPRRCLRPPISQIYEAAALLDRATGAHLAGDVDKARVLIRRADMPGVRDWVESLWGGAKANPGQSSWLRFRPVEGAPASLPKGSRHQTRMPTAADKIRLLDHYGRNCAFCGIPLITARVRDAFRAAYPGEVYWGDTNLTQHPAFQCLWLQYDHLLPHSRGGDASVQNVAITCAPCNYGRGERTLEEMGLLDP